MKTSDIDTFVAEHTNKTKNSYWHKKINEWCGVNDFQYIWYGENTDQGHNKYYFVARRSSRYPNYTYCGYGTIGKYPTFNQYDDLFKFGKTVTLKSKTYETVYEYDHDIN